MAMPTKTWGLALLCLLTLQGVLGNSCSPCKCTDNNGALRLSINCAGMDLTEIPTFTDLPSAAEVTLFLHDNNLTTIPADGFTGLSNLTKIFLSSNSIHSIHEYAFINQTTTLREVYLQENLLTSDSLRAFKTMTELRILTLDNNKISIIANSTFELCVKLKQLSVKDNSLHKVESKAFPPWVENWMRSLNLANNQLQTDSLQALSDMKNIMFLDLSYNRISALTNDVFYWMRFTLRTLDITHNAIQSIEDEVFLPHVGDLTSVNLQSNQITSDSLRAFKDVQMLYLDLRDNNLTTIPDVFYKLISISLSGNPIVCNCSIEWTDRCCIRFDNWKCAAPPHLDGTIFDDIRFHKEKYCDTSSTFFRYPSLWMVVTVAVAVTFRSSICFHQM